MEEEDVMHYEFAEALNLVKSGTLMSREGWNGKGMYIFLVPGSTFEVSRAPLLGIFPLGTVINYRPHIDMKYADGTVGVWSASAGDLMANDWVIVRQ